MSEEISVTAMALDIREMKRMLETTLERLEKFESKCEKETDRNEEDHRTFYKYLYIGMGITMAVSTLIGVVFRILNA